MFKPIIIILLSVSLLWGGCKKDSTTYNTINESLAIDTSGIYYATPQGLMDNGYDENDLLENENFDKKIKVKFGYPIQIHNDFDNEVVIQYVGNDVKITSSATGIEFELSGTASDGSIKIYSEKKFQLTLNNLVLQSDQGAPINIQSKKRVFVHLTAGSVNQLIDTSHYNNIEENEDLKAAFFSEGQLIFNGTGSLEIEANYKHAICSDEYLHFREGNFNITKAASDAFHANDYIVIDNGNYRISADSDGIEAENGYIIINNGIIDINVLDDGIVAAYKNDDSLTPYIIIHNGEININTVEGEGLESKADLFIHNGKINIEAYDDAVNAHNLLIINNGVHFFKSLTNDGIDSNNEIEINGGIIMAFGAASPEGGIDNDRFPFRINGGLIVGIGGRNSIPSSNLLNQPVLVFSIKGISTSFALLQNNNLLSAITIPPNSNSLFYSDSRMKINEQIVLMKDVQINNSDQNEALHFSGTAIGGNTMYETKLVQKLTILNQF